MFVASCDFSNQHEKSGTKNMARKVAASMPPSTVVPMAIRLAALRRMKSQAGIPHDKGHGSHDDRTETNPGCLQSGFGQ